MIVPRTRLLVWFAFVALPFAVVAGTIPAAALLAWTAIFGFAAIALLDAATAHGRLAGIRVRLPDVVRLQKDREGAIDLQIENDTLLARSMRFGLALPREIVSARSDLIAGLPAGAALSRVSWPCTPLKRGQFFLDRCHLEAVSQLGFWAARGSSPAQTELRVYPNLFDERKNVAALFLNRGRFGIHAQRQTGKGREFEKLRDYIPGDGYDEIHWKASAKRGHPVTKVFQVERTQEIYVIVDASRLSAREEPGKSNALERFVTAALILGVAAEQQGDSFGLVTFADKVRGFVRAKSGQAHFAACRDTLYTLQPQIVTPDFDELCAFIRMRMRKRALLVFLTCLDDPMLAESFVRSMDIVCRQHLVLVNMLKPRGAEPLFADGNVADVDALYSKLGGHFQWHNLRELEKVLQRRGVRFNLLDNEKMAAQLVTQYLGVKARQLI